MLGFRQLFRVRMYADKRDPPPSLRTMCPERNSRSRARNRASGAARWTRTGFPSHYGGTSLGYLGATSASSLFPNGIGYR